MTGERVLVLGGTGFIGANVVRALLASGRSVRVLHREGSDTRALRGVEPAVELVHGDLKDRASLVKAMRNSAHVVHAAGYYPVVGLDTPAALRSGVTQMRNVLSAAREAHVQRLVYTSTLTTIGPSPDPRRLADERDHYLPGSVPSAYCEVKWAMEQEVHHAVARGMDAVILNPGIVLGEWDVKPTSGRIVTYVAQGRWPFFVEGKTSVVHARDVAAAHVAALERGERGERYIVGGENVWMRELVGLIAREAGSEPPRFEVPYTMARAASYATELAARLGAEVGERVERVRPGLGRAMRRPPLLPLEAVEVLHHAQPLDGGKAREELGVQPTPVVEAVRDALRWFRRNGYLSGDGGTPPHEADLPRAPVGSGDPVDWRKS